MIRAIAILGVLLAACRPPEPNETETKAIVNAGLSLAVQLVPVINRPLPHPDDEKARNSTSAMRKFFRYFDQTFWALVRCEAHGQMSALTNLEKVLTLATDRKIRLKPTLDSQSRSVNRSLMTLDGSDVRGCEVLGSRLISWQVLSSLMFRADLAKTAAAVLSKDLLAHLQKNAASQLAQETRESYRVTQLFYLGIRGPCQRESVADGMRCSPFKSSLMDSLVTTFIEQAISSKDASDELRKSLTDSLSQQLEPFDRMYNPCHTAQETLLSTVQLEAKRGDQRQFDCKVDPETGYGHYLPRSDDFDATIGTLADKIAQVHEQSFATAALVEGESDAVPLAKPLDMIWDAMTQAKDWRLYASERTDNPELVLLLNYLSGHHDLGFALRSWRTGASLVERRNLPDPAMLRMRELALFYGLFGQPFEDFNRRFPYRGSMYNPRFSSESDSSYGGMFDFMRRGARDFWRSSGSSRSVREPFRRLEQGDALDDLLEDVTSGSLPSDPPETSSPPSVLPESDESSEERVTDEIAKTPARDCKGPTRTVDFPDLGFRYRFGSMNQILDEDLQRVCGCPTVTSPVALTHLKGRPLSCCLLKKPGADRCIKQWKVFSECAFKKEARGRRTGTGPEDFVCGD